MKENKNLMTAIFQILIKVAQFVGNVNRANMHDESFMLVEGTSHDGRPFTVSLSIQDKEDEENGN